MRSSIIFAFVAAATAADVSITWRHEKSSGSTSLTIREAKGDTVLAETCGNTLGSLNFVNADENGAGNLTVGGATFDISSRVQDGVSCTRTYNGDIAVVDCSGISFEVPKGTAQSANCFNDENAKASFLALNRRNMVLHVPTPTEKRSTPAQMFKLRGRQQCHSEETTYPVGDGNPHQNYYHKQLSVSIPLLVQTSHDGLWLICWLSMFRKLSTVALPHLALPAIRYPNLTLLDGPPASPLIRGSRPALMCKSRGRLGTNIAAPAQLETMYASGTTPLTQPVSDT